MNNMEKILTVSIAAYNVETFIEEALDSFLVPEIMNKIEVLVINDGGTDQTMEKAKKYADQYPDTFKLVYKENGGWGSTVNYGIKHATGKYFKLLDGDDYFEKDNLIAFIELLEKTSADLVHTDFVTFEDITRKIVVETSYAERYAQNEMLDWEDLEIDYMIAMHACTFRTKMLQESDVHVHEKLFYTDNEYVVRALASVKSILFSDLKIYWYRVGRAGQSVSIEGYRKHYTDHIAVTLTLLSIYKNANISDKLRKILYDRIFVIVDIQYDIFLKLKPSMRHMKELNHFDRILRDKYPEFYQTTRRRIKTFRKFGALAYPFVLYRR